MKYDVFISYRREGGDTLAQLLYDRLTHRGYRVFLDIESLNAGKFNEKLLDVIEECKDIVVVLPPNALDRCVNEGDWLYREIEHSIKLSKNIVPVMMKGFVWPDNIPEAIADIQNYNGILDNKDYFDAVIDKITTLLKSKPMIGGGFRTKYQGRTFTLKEKAKKKKRIIAAVLAGAVCCTGVVGLLHYYKAQQQLKAESNVTIKLTANEEMGASDYYDAIDILEKRFELLAGGQDFSFEAEEDTIHVSIPLDVFHEVDVLDILKSSVTRPGEMYLAPSELSDEDNFFHIERSSIESVEIVSDVPVTFDTTNYEMKGVENPEDYQYIAVTLDQDTVDSLQNWMDDVNADRYHEFGDYEEFGFFDSYYGLAEFVKDDNAIYLLNNCQYENFFNLTQYNLSNETFSQAFYIEMQMPVKWENIENTEYAPGENQCNEEDLTGPLVRLDYTRYSYDITDGEYQDIIQVMKSRLDALDTPYSFGYRTDNPHAFAVKLNPVFINDQIADLIGEMNSFAINSNFYNLTNTYSAESVEILQKENGTCYLEITPPSYWYDDENTLECLNALEDSSSIMLCQNGLPFSETTLGEAFNGETFIFDNLSSFNLETVDAEHEYIFQLIKTVITGEDIPHSYDFELIGYENVESEDFELPLVGTASKELQKECEEILASIDTITEYEVSVSNLGQYVSIDLELPTDDTYAENCNQILQSIYQELDLASGDISTLWIYFNENLDDGDYAYYGSDDGYYTYYDIHTNIYSTHTMEFRAYASDYVPEEDLAEIKEILNSDEFYDQFYVDEYYRDGNGNIAIL